MKRRSSSARSPRSCARLGATPPRTETLLGLRGVLDIVSREDDEKLAPREAAMLKSLDERSALLLARRDEGAQAAAIIAAHIDRIEALTIAARDNPARSVEAISARLAEQVARLMRSRTPLRSGPPPSGGRACSPRAPTSRRRSTGSLRMSRRRRRLLAAPEPVGRKLDFLAQEFNREANTLCSKATDRAYGDRPRPQDGDRSMREQVQNIE